jgi:hypothetical protein
MQRLVSSVENGTYVLFGTEMAGCGTGENTLADKVVESLAPGFLCLGDRNFFYAASRVTIDNEFPGLENGRNTRNPCEPEAMSPSG